MKWGRALVSAAKQTAALVRKARIPERTKPLLQKLLQKNGEVKLSSMKGFNPLKSVGTQLFVLFLASILICVLTVGLLSYSKSKSIIEEKVAGASHQTITQSAEKLDLIFKQFDQLSFQIFLDPQIKGNLANMKDPNFSDYDKMLAGKAVEEKLSSFMFSNNSISGIYMISLKPELRNLYSSGSISSFDMSNEPWFQKTKELDGKLYWVETKKEGHIVKNSPTFGAARVIKDANSGSGDYVMFLEIKLDMLSKEIESVNLGEGSEIFMVGTSNNIILSSHVDQIGSASSIELKADSEDVPGESKQDGKLIVFDPSESTGWTLVGQIPVNVLVKEAQSIFTLTMIIAVIAAIMAVAIGFLVARRIGTPLVQLKELMQQGEQGDLTVRSNFKREDEIGLVGDSFNQMMDKITLLLQQTANTAQSVLDTAGELSDVSKKTAISAREISVATEEIASGASSLATEAERGMDLTTMIETRVKQVVSANAHMAGASQEVQQASSKGTVYMVELTAKTNQTEEMTRSMVEKVDKLKESTQSIRKILEMLTGISKQTNILSLNATIEAARAGAAGRGFMVVADEIRKLADQSRESIDVVGQITDKIQVEIDETVSVLTEAYPMFQQQIQSVKEASEIFDQVEERMAGLVTQLDEVTGSVSDLEKSQRVLTDAMSNVSAVAEESSATSQEVASLSTEQLSISEGLVRLSDKLESVSVTLRESLSQFKVS
ncbi:methyl-accepting chemotaxis protein [Paenibacillus turpanensis]|uniref:methyl-accepting chemotaxis protein n=1 Tax=Paenibacillus turpanensis TaxID=2689078 RepID=UPI003132D06E